MELCNINYNLESIDPQYPLHNGVKLCSTIYIMELSYAVSITPQNQAPQKSIIPWSQAPQYQSYRGVKLCSTKYSMESSSTVPSVPRCQALQYQVYHGVKLHSTNCTTVSSSAVLSIPWSQAPHSQYQVYHGVNLCSTVSIKQWCHVPQFQLYHGVKLCCTNYTMESSSAVLIPQGEILHSIDTAEFIYN